MARTRPKGVTTPRGDRQRLRFERPRACVRTASAIALNAGGAGVVQLARRAKEPQSWARAQGNACHIMAYSPCRGRENAAS